MVARKRGTFADCTHIIVSILKVWKVTVVGSCVTVPPFNVISRRSKPDMVGWIRGLRALSPYNGTIFLLNEFMGFEAT